MTPKHINQSWISEQVYGNNKRRALVGAKLSGRTRMTEQEEEAYIKALRQIAVDALTLARKIKSND